MTKEEMEAQCNLVSSFLDAGIDQIDEVDEMEMAIEQRQKEWQALSPEERELRNKKWREENA